jgi:metallo-beta-lactamase family protein
MQDAPSLRFFGAAGSVTGSRFLLQVGRFRVLVDCGLFQEPELESRNLEAFPVDPETIDAVILTHGHLDHCGYLPRLVRDGFHGPIWCTSATRDIAEIIWLDAARIALSDYRRAERAQRTRRTKSSSRPTEPIYRAADANRALRQVQTVEFDHPTEILRGLTLTFRDAGHILGAATAHLRWEQGRDSLRVLFSGDLGRPDRPILHDPAPPLPADVVVVETTYGGRLHPHGDIEDQFAEIIQDTERRGGALVIPAFAVQRAQEVLFHLRRLFDAGRIPWIPVYLDSPMAQAVTGLFQHYTHLLDDDAASIFRSGHSPFDFPSLRITEATEDSIAIARQTGPVIIIAGSGMCEGGRVLSHLERLLGLPDTTILFVGYQAPGTLGSRIIDGAKNVRVLGRPIEVRAHIACIDEFSAHADRDEIADWLAQLPTPPRRVLAVHGTPESASAFAMHLEARLGWATSVPAFGETVMLSATE